MQGLTGSPEGISQLASCHDRLLPTLFRLVGGPASVSRPALISLVNLSQEPSVQRKLLNLNAPARCMDYLKEHTCPGQEDLLVMLLANLTAAEEGAAALMQLGKGPLEGLNLAILLKLFLEEEVKSKSKGSSSTTDDVYRHVATVLPNLTRFREARQVLLESGRGTLRALASQLRSSSELRRRGCAGAIKNCCFSCEEDETAEAISTEEAALTDILGVLAGIPTTETDDSVRETLAEAVLCLAKVDVIRKQMWTLNAPDLLKKAYELEEHQGVCDALEDAAECFMRDGFGDAEEELGGGDGGDEAEDDEINEGESISFGGGVMSFGGKMRPPTMAAPRTSAAAPPPPPSVIVEELLPQHYSARRPDVSIEELD